MLLKTVAAAKLDPALLITHRFSLSDALAAYDVFESAGKTGAPTIIITP